MTLQTRYSAGPVQNLTEWDVTSVKKALAQLENGDFRLAAALVDAMTRDDRIASNLNMRIQGVLGLPSHLEESEEDAPTAQKTKAMNLLEKKRLKIADKHTRADLLKWQIMLGVALGQLVWNTEADEWGVEVETWHPSALSYDPYAKNYRVQTVDAGQIVIDPKQNKWALITQGRDRPQMNGLVRALAIPWLIRQFAWRDWARHSEVHGLPIRKAKVPTEAETSETNRFLAQVADLANETVILTPYTRDQSGNEIGFDIELIEAAANDHKSFDDLLTRCDDALTIAILGQNLTTQVSGGSLAAARVHDRVRHDLIEADALGLAEGLREQVYRPYCLFNVGSADAAPLDEYETDPPDDLKSKADTYSTLGDAIGKLKGNGVQLDLEQLTEDFGLPVTATEFAEPEPAPETEAPAQGKKPAAGKTLNRQGGTPVLASGDRPEDAPGFVEGQLYVDGVVETAVSEAQRVMNRDIAALVRIINEAEGYDEVRAAVLAHFKEYKGEKIRGLIQTALTLGKLAGLYAVQEEASV